MNIKNKLKYLANFLIVKGGKKNLSKLIKVRRPFNKNGKVYQRFVWVKPNEVKSNEQIHADHKLHHLLPKDHPDYKKKELHPNFVAGRNKALENRKAKKGSREKELAEHQSKMRDAALKAMDKEDEEDRHRQHIHHFMANTEAPSTNVSDIKKHLKEKTGKNISHKKILNLIHETNKAHDEEGMKRAYSFKKLNTKNPEVSMHPAFQKLVKKQARNKN